MMKERVITVTLITDQEDPEYDIKELTELAEAAGSEVILEETNTRKKVNPSLYIGTGKADELRDLAREFEVETIIFNHELTGTQIRNLEKRTDCKIVDRTSLILDIFALRAHTKESRLQVKLAQLEYRLPRLEGYGNYLSRLGGGIGTRGPGEQQIETDRRRIRLEIHNIKKELEEVVKTRDITRQNRRRNRIPLISLVGYTNAGKSTIGNKLLEEESEEFKVKNRLFQTLDTKIRKGEIDDQEFLIADTVGFVKNLPTNLVEAFKSTLEEIRYADIILHIIDSSSADIFEQLKTTNDILDDMNIRKDNRVIVFNKKDLTDGSLSDYYNNFDKSSIFISAYNDKDMDRLKNRILEVIYSEYKLVTMEIPHTEYHIISELLDRYNYEKLKHLSEFNEITLYIDSIDQNKYKDYIKGDQDG